MVPDIFFLSAIFSFESIANGCGRQIIRHALYCTSAEIRILSTIHITSDGSWRNTEGKKLETTVIEQGSRSVAARYASRLVFLSLPAATV